MKYSHNKLLITIIILLMFIATLCACNTNKCEEGHTWKLTSTTATCYDGGIETYTCETCKETKTKNVEVYGHDLVQSSYTAPTCKTNGEEVKKCTRCGFESKQTLLIIDHDYEVKSTTPSTCTVKGSQTLECSMCHETKTKELPLLEHNFQPTKTVYSTCVTHGKQFYRCKNCTETYSEELPLAEHTYKTITKQSTCFTHGGTVKKCSVCKDEKIVKETPILTHDFDSNGYCTHCGICETLFDIDKLDIKTTVVDLLSVIQGNLVPKFSNDNTVPDNYWVDHNVVVTLSLFDAENELIGEKNFISHIDNVGKLTIQSTQFVELNQFKHNMIFLRLYGDKVFSDEILTACTSFKIKIACNGYKTIEKTHNLT